jgi:hypothetical protein
MIIKLTEEELSDIKDALKITIKVAHVMEMESRLPTDRWQKLFDRFEFGATADAP